MTEHTRQDCEAIEALLPAYVEGDLSPGEAVRVFASAMACESCREAMETYVRMEKALVSRRDEVPPAASFIPDLASLRAANPAVSRERVDAVATARGPMPRAPRPAYAHPRLVAALRALTSPAGIAAVLVVWIAMLLLRYRDAVGEIFTWTTLDRLEAVTTRVSGTLVALSGGDVWALSAIYLAIALAVLASTGAITLRFLRQQ